MSVSVWLWAHLQSTLLLSALLCLAPLPPGRGRAVGIAAAALLIPLLTLGGIDLAGRLYAHSGALSLPGMTLLAAFVTHRLGGPTLLPPAEREGWLRALPLLALLLYPPSLGLGGFDPYGLGFADPGLPVILVFAALLLWFSGRRASALLLSAILWGWLLGLGESDNLWDYLLDAWTALAALAIQARSAMAGSRRAGREKNP